MKTIGEAFIELVSCLEIAKFDDPDEAQGAEEVVSRCLAESSDEERAVLCAIASKKAEELRAGGAPQSVVDFYERL